MLSDRRSLAWNELELGPLWRRRQHLPVPGGPPMEAAAQAADAAQAEDAAQAAENVQIADAVRFGGAVQVGDAVRDRWGQVQAEVSACRGCGLCETRNRTVFGSGPQGARWMLIGEAPGADEDAGGEPFVGQAGRLLDRMLASIGLSRQHDVFITNVLKCRPPGNRNPQPLEAATCAPFLYRQIDLVKPDLILLLGRFAVQSILKTESNLAGLRRQVHRYAATDGDIPVVCTYHPAYLLRNLPEKKKAWEDLCLAMDVATRQQALRHQGEAGH